MRVWKVSAVLERVITSAVYAVPSKARRLAREEDSVLLADSLRSSEADFNLSSSFRIKDYNHKSSLIKNLCLDL